jgi:predicted DCC family thiol-disulfide oxidoreductase YuxK
VSAEPVTVLYDPDCGFCRVCLAVLLTWDRADRLRPVPLFGSEAARLLAGMPEADQAASWHAVDGDGGVQSGGAAFGPVLDVLPRGRGLAALGRRLPGALDSGYRWVADHRTLMGRFVPDAARSWADDVLRVSGQEPSGR